MRRYRIKKQWIIGYGGWVFTPERLGWFGWEDLAPHQYVKSEGDARGVIANDVALNGKKTIIIPVENPKPPKMCRWSPDDVGNVAKFVGAVGFLLMMVGTILAFALHEAGILPS